MDMEERWERLETYLHTAAPVEEPTFEFSEPATAEELDDAEAELGLSFPPSVRRSYRVHDGTADTVDELFGLWQLLPLDEVLSTAASMAEIGDQFGYEECWDPRVAIPIMHRTNGDLAYVEHAPDGEETPVVMWNHETHGHVEAAPSFGAFFDDYLAAIDGGDCEVEQWSSGRLAVSCADAPTPWSM